jgi:small subunit ribosomal protein MRP21
MNARSLSREEELEAEWANRPLLGTPPAKPHTGRTVQIDQAGRNVAVGYKILMATLNRNAVRRELKLTERYEKPNQMRVRKKSERHRRRFAEMIREKVKLVSTQGRPGRGAHREAMQPE